MGNSESFILRSNINSFSILDLEDETQISILDVDGNRVENHNTNNPEFSWMSDSNFQSGVYVVNVSDKKGRVKSFKLIVVK